jgi:hypothetical protein
MNAPNGTRIPRTPPRPEAEAQVLKEIIGLLRGISAPGRKTSSGWPFLRIMRKIRVD